MPNNIIDLLVFFSRIQHQVVLVEGKGLMYFLSYLYYSSPSREDIRVRDTRSRPDEEVIISLLRMNLKQFTFIVLFLLVLREGEAQDTAQPSSKATTTNNNSSKATMNLLKRVLVLMTSRRLVRTYFFVLEKRTLNLFLLDVT